MPYVLQLPLVDGQPPASSYWEENEDYQPAENEVVVSKEEYEDTIEVGVGPGLWDETTQTLRGRTEADALADLKTQKKQELADSAGTIIGEHLTFPTMGLGDREVLMILATAVKRICDALGVVPDERIALIADTGALVLDAVNRVDDIPNDAENAREQFSLHS
jgi:hypothetical protein